MIDSGITLTTPRLVMRPIREDDFPHHLEMMTDPRVMTFSKRGLLDEEGVRAWQQGHFRRIREHGHGFMAAVLRETGEYVGHAGVLIQELEGHQVSEVGYWLRHGFWGQGYAVEAASAVRDYGFKTLGKPELVSLIDPDNARSRKVADRMGMNLHRLASWRDAPTCVYGIGRAAWKELQEPGAS